MHKTRLLLSLTAVILFVGTFIVMSDCRSGCAYHRGVSPPQMEEVCHASMPTLVIFSAEWCGYCTKLEEHTLTDPAVKERLRGYAVEIVDVDKNRGLARAAGVHALPTAFILTRACVTKSRTEGYQTPEEFLKWLDEAEKP